VNTKNTNRIGTELITMIIHKNTTHIEIYEKYPKTININTNTYMVTKQTVRERTIMLLSINM